MAQKHYITPEDLRKGSYQLAMMALRDSFHPDMMIALWRGGAPIGCHVHEAYKFHNVDVDHIAIRTSRFEGIDKEASKISVHNLGYLADNIHNGYKILVVDDVWDKGLTIIAFFDKIKEVCAEKGVDYTTLDIRVAVLYYKPSRNLVGLTPTYFVHTSDKWLVFPHELEGMSVTEVEEVMGKDIASILELNRT